MTRYSAYNSFAESLLAYLPEIADLEVRNENYWNQLEVNTSRVTDEMMDSEIVARKLNSIGAAGQQVLSIWLGRAPLSSQRDVVEFAEHIVTNREESSILTVMLIIDFIYRRRPDAIETLCGLILANEIFSFIERSSAEINAKRFLYTVAAYVKNPHYLRLLMLFESAERVGYKRYNLVAETPDGDDADEVAELRRFAEEKINQGADLSDLAVGRINAALEAFERTHGQYKSLCYEVFHDESAGIALVFIFRYLRESHIREVEQTIFAEEAELIVLRFSDKMRLVEDHSISGIGTKIATLVASDILEAQNVKYVRSEYLNSAERVDNLIQALVAESDDKIRLHELYLFTAPLDDNPILMLRSSSRHGIAKALRDLSERGTYLLNDLDDIRHISIRFDVPIDDDNSRSYSFKVFVHHVRSDRYFLRYSVANIATSIRQDFERYLRKNYDVRVFP